MNKRFVMPEMRISTFNCGIGCSEGGVTYESSGQPGEIIVPDTEPMTSVSGASTSSAGVSAYE